MAKYERSYGVLRVSHDVKIRECGGLSLKRGECIALAGDVYRAVSIQYRELVPCGKIKKESDKQEECALSKRVYEIFQPKLTDDGKIVKDADGVLPYPAEPKPKPEPKSKPAKK